MEEDIILYYIIIAYEISDEDVALAILFFKMKIKSSTLKEIVVVFINNKSETDEEINFVYGVAGEQAELAPLFSGSIWWSAIIWERSVQTICHFMEENTSLFRHKQVVELGCGLGVPGMVAALTCEASKVFLTDSSEDL